MDKSPVKLLRGSYAQLTILAMASLCVAFGTACRRETTSDRPNEESAGVVEKLKKAEVVVFPPELQVGDSAVNDFVHTALSRIAAGNYEAFRSLWTARQETLARDQFEEGWEAVQKIEVRALEKVKLAGNEERENGEPETVYILLVEVSLDPVRPAGQRDPLREIALMLSWERDDWRLARPPRAMREWIKNRMKAPAASDDAQVPSGDTQSATPATKSQGGG